MIIQESGRIHRTERRRMNEQNGAIEVRIYMTVSARTMLLNQTDPAGWKEDLLTAATSLSGKFIQELNNMSLTTIIQIAFTGRILSSVVKMFRSIQAC